MRPLLLLALAIASAALSCKGGDEEPPPPPPPEPPDCGNGLLEEGEVCEGMPTPIGCNPNTCQVSVGFVCSPEPPDTSMGETGGVFEPIEWTSTCEKLETCGDGIIDPDEDCDDGDMELMDGCSNCMVDPLWTCVGEPSDCMKCGDGFVDPGEECDDGEECDVCMPSPGCESCMVVEGWQCFEGMSGYSQCGPLCGDGILFDTRVVSVGFAEECDDGNLIDGDGCNNNCDIEDDCFCEGDAYETSVCFCGMGDSTGDSSSGGSSSGSSSGGSGSTGSTGGSSTGGSSSTAN